MENSFDINKADQHNHVFFGWLDSGCKCTIAICIWVVLKCLITNTTFSPLKKLASLASFMTHCINYWSPTKVWHRTAEPQPCDPVSSNSLVLPVSAQKSQFGYLVGPDIVHQNDWQEQRILVHWSSHF